MACNWEKKQVQAAKVLDGIDSNLTTVLPDSIFPRCDDDESSKLCPTSDQDLTVRGEKSERVCKLPQES